MEVYTDHERTPKVGKTVQLLLWDCEECGEVTLTKPEEDSMVDYCGCRKSHVDVGYKTVRIFGQTRIIKLYKK